VRLALLLLLVPRLAAATITFVSAGTGTGVTATTCTPGIPASIQESDVLLVALHSRTNTAHTCTTNCSGVGDGGTSWTVMGTQAGGTTGGRTSIWWLRRGSTFTTAPTFGGPATESYVCQMYAFRGVRTSGNPHDVVGTYQAEASGTTFTGDAVVTTLESSMLMFAVGGMDDNQWGTPGGGVNASAGYTQNANGTDDSVALAYDSTPDDTCPGTQTAPTFVQSLNGPDAGRSTTFALASAAPTSTCGGSGGMMGFWP
jgi:hypothetical protein